MAASNEKVPLQQSTNGDTVDYDALFKREGDSRDHMGKFYTKTAIGEYRNPKRFHWFEWVFLVVATLSMLGVLALTAYRFYYFDANFINITIVNQTSGVEELARCNSVLCISDFIFAVALLVNLAFCAFYCYDGVLRERPFEVLAYVVAVIVIIIYTIGNFGYQLYRINYNNSHDNNSVTDTSDFHLKIARLVLVVIFGPVNIVLALFSWWKMGFLAFNVIGADKTLQWAYRSRSFFLTLQWFSLQVLLNIFVLAWSREGYLLSLAEKIILPLVVVLVFLIILVGNVAVLWEYQVASIIWYILLVPYAVYCLYKLINVSVNWSHYSREYVVHNTINHEQDDVKSTFTFVGASLLIACIIGMIVSVLLVVFMMVAQRYYGRGLKDKIPPPFSKTTQRK